MIWKVSTIDREVIISQLTDDKTLFLKDSSQISFAIDVIWMFSNASGLHLNISKYELMDLKDCEFPSICSIPIERVTYLGIIITKNHKVRCDLNFIPIIERTRKKLNQRLQRDLSLMGTTLLSKAEGISRLTYAAISLAVDKKLLYICKDIDQLLYNFVWKTKIILKSLSWWITNNGDLNFIDFSTLNNTFKVNWIRHYLKKLN